MADIYRVTFKDGTRELLCGLCVASARKYGEMRGATHEQVSPSTLTVDLKCDVCSATLKAAPRPEAHS